MLMETDSVSDECIVGLTRTSGVKSSRSSGLNSAVDVQVIVTEKEGDIEKWQYRKPAYGAVALVMGLTAFAVLFPMIITSEFLGLRQSVYRSPPPCPDQCRFTMVESIPENLTYPAGSPLHMSTFDGWMGLLTAANRTIDIASYYWTLRGEDVKIQDPSTWQGEEIFHQLMLAGTTRGIKVRIVQNSGRNNADTRELAKMGAADVRALDMERLVGAGILHTKFWIVDDQHLYVGSANMDFRSLTQVKELGAVVRNCSCLAKDLKKIFEAYWYLAQKNVTVPKHWRPKYNTEYNWDTPMEVQLNNTPAHVFLSSSPPRFCPSGRTVDIDAILHVIQAAERFIHIAVMDYFPTTLYMKHNIFWPVIDDALRRAAIERGVEVQLLASLWNYTYPSMPHYLNSLAVLNGADEANIQVKLFVVPIFTPAQGRIPYSRVNHNKYMVTDKTAYIGTSNWSGDYFISTAGVGLAVRQNSTEGTTIQEELAAVFNRDWNSSYAKPVQDVIHSGLHNYSYEFAHSGLDL